MTTTAGDFHDWAARGFGPELIPIIPPLVLMSPSSGVPLDQRGKVPGMRGGAGWHSYGWREAPQATPEDHARWQEMGASVGLRLGSVVAADVDVLDEVAARLLRQVAELTLGESPVRVGRAPKGTMLYRARPGLKKRKIRFSLPGAGEHGVELLAEGQQSVIDGVHPGTGQPYAWPEGRPRLADLPMVDEDAIEAFMRNVEIAVDMLGGEVLARATGAADSDRSLIDQAGLAAPSLEALEAALVHVPNDGGYDEWIPGLCAIRAAATGLADDDGRELAREWTNRWEGGGQGAHIDFDAKWDQQRPPFRVGWNWVEVRARAGGWKGGAALDFAGVQAPVMTPGSGKKKPRSDMRGGADKAGSGVDLGAGDTTDSGTLQERLYQDHVYIRPIDRVGSLVTKKLAAKSEFNVTNNHIGHPDDAKKSAWGVFRSDAERCVQVDGVTYRPGRGVLIDEDGVGVCFNRWRPGPMAPAKGVTREQIQPWLDHLDYIVEEEHLREHVQDYMGFLVQKQDAKVNHAMVFGGGVRTGKDTIWAPLRMYFAHNAEDVPVKKLKSSFNDWCENKRVIFINEMYSDERVALGDELKTIIAAPPFMIPISAKFMPPYAVPNILGVVIFTNHRDALALKRDAGRYCVVWHKAARRSDEYYAGLWAWLQSGGYELVVGYLMERQIRASFNPGGVAPWSAGRDEMAEASVSEAEAAVSEAFDVNAWPDLVNPGDLAMRLRDGAGRGQLTSHRVAKILRNMGAEPLFKGESIPCPGLGKRVRVWAVRDFHRYGGLAKAALAREYEKAWADHAAREAAGTDFRTHLVSGESPTSAKQVGSPKT